MGQVNSLTSDDLPKLCPIFYEMVSLYNTQTNSGHPCQHMWKSRPITSGNPTESRRVVHYFSHRWHWSSLWVSRIESKMEGLNVVSVGQIGGVSHVMWPREFPFTGGVSQPVIFEICCTFQISRVISDIKIFVWIFPCKRKLSTVLCKAPGSDCWCFYN
jgi:hypothetical protein